MKSMWFAMEKWSDVINEGIAKPKKSGSRSARSAVEGQLIEQGKTEMDSNK